jgi:DNA-binding NarL/FixJ family response regulator
MITQVKEPRAAKEPETASQRAKILVVDDHPIVRQGLSQLLLNEPDLVVCGEAEDAPQAMTAIENLAPDLIVVDIALRGASGVELIKNVHARWPELPVLVLSMHDEALYGERCLRAGARGYIMKQAATENMVTAIRKVLSGDIYVSPTMSEKILSQFLFGGNQHRSAIERLTDRELEVLTLLGRGRGTRQIADELHLSMKTIESHRAHLKEKLGLRDAPELVRFAVEWVNSEMPA